MKTLHLGLAAAAALLSCVRADAADIPAPVYKAAPVMAPAFNWSGFYIGGNVGYGWGDINSGTIGGSADIDGWFVGGQLGWNWQAAGSPWVWGFEIDSQWANIENGATVTAGNAVATAFSDLNYFGTARLRLGYAWDRAMFYGTGGLAWGSNDIGVGVAVNGLTAGVNSSNTHLGWTVGAGLEWALIDNWSAKIEYLYIKLDSEQYFGGIATGGFDADIDVHTIKVGLNYRFGYGKNPVMARY